MFFSDVKHLLQKLIVKLCKFVKHTSGKSNFEIVYFTNAPVIKSCAIWYGLVNNSVMPAEKVFLKFVPLDGNLFAVESRNSLTNEPLVTALAVMMKTRKNIY